MTDDIAFQSAVQLAARTKSKEISSVELTQHYIDRIERYDGAINAVIVRTFEQALQRSLEWRCPQSHRKPPHPRFL